MKIKYIVKDNSRTINDILLNDLKTSNRLLNKLIRNKSIYVNNQICNTKNLANYGDCINIDFNYTEDNSNIKPCEMILDIIYEDEWLLVISKPSGIAIHPSLLHYDNSLSNGVKYYFDKIHLHKKIRPVNRLDTNTSGLVIFAKCEYVQELLIKQMQNKTFIKEYLCIISGILEEKSGTINLPISRKENSIIERCVNKNGQKSITHYTVLKEFKNYSLIKCILETGRTHQIRVHFSYIGHPLLGDTLYGTPSHLINRQALHSYKIDFIHPITNKKFCLTCDIPDDMKKLIIE